MGYVVFECRKCGHDLYVENTTDMLEKIDKVSNLACPHCGEDPDGNWLLVGAAYKFPCYAKGGE